MTTAPLRFATYNVEWFNGLFDDQARLLRDSEPSARYEISRATQLDALGIVFNALNADAVMVIEAPDTNGKRSSVTALERFAAHYGLRARRAVTGFPSETEQEISLLYDPDRLTAKHDPIGEPMGKRRHVPVPRFDGTFRYDQDTDAGNAPMRFSKPPLELDVRTAEGRALRIIGVHAKSKAPHGARNAADAMAINLENRRKQLAQCLWLRQRVAGHLQAGDSLIVLGDFNDGPGLDEYEHMFGRSGVEIVLGNDADPTMQLFDPHAQMALTQKVGLVPTTARFYLAPKQRFFEALLDFIMVSPDLAATHPSWRIWHPLNDPTCWKAPELRDALLAASDHFPVTLDVIL
ncbi:MAG: endonuclease/exonuclease/phosphatase family protein [Paracoccaceae bacterium]